MFTEPDWRLAVQRFRQWEVQHAGCHALLPLASEPLTEVFVGEASEDDDEAVKAILLHEMGAGDHTSSSDVSLILRLAAERPVSFLRAVPTAILLQHVREEPITRRQWRAEQAGIEQLAYLPALKRIVSLPRPRALQILWEEKSTCDRDQRRKVSRAWEDFVYTTGLDRLQEITPKLCVSFRNHLRDRGLSGKQQQHICAGIRRVMFFAIDQSLHVEALTTI